MNHASPNGDGSRYSTRLLRCKVVNYQTLRVKIREKRKKKKIKGGIGVKSSFC